MNRVSEMSEINYGKLLKNLCKDKEQKYMVQVQKDGLALENINYQTNKLCLAAVQNDALALEFVKDQTLDICNEAIEKSGFAIIYVKDQTDDLCIKAIQKNALRGIRDKDRYKVSVEINGQDKKLVQITDLISFRKTFKYTNDSLVEFIKNYCERCNDEILTSSFDDEKDEGTYIVKMNDDQYEVVKKEKVNKIIEGYIYNSEEKVMEIIKLYSFTEINVEE